MLRMMTYLEANLILDSSLSPNNYCICKKTALENGADPDEIAKYLPSNASSGNTATPELTNGHEYVDLGLPSGTLWAKCNVGASSETGYGNFYDCGAGSTTFNASNPEYYGEEDPLSLSVDTARIVMGGEWHMPTLQQCTELRDYCTVETNVTLSGVVGTKIIGLNGNYIFIPSSGMIGSYGDPSGAGLYGYFWSSSIDWWYVYSGDEITNSEPRRRYVTIYPQSGITISNAIGIGMPVRGVLSGLSSSSADTLEANRLVPVAAVKKYVEGYTIIWKDWDGTVLKTEKVAKDSTPQPPSDPTRDGYSFTGWSPQIEPATKPLIYTAQYSDNTVYYTITWKDSLDPSWSRTSYVAEGGIPSYSAPSHSGYSFVGWSPNPSAAYSDAVYTAIYTEDSGGGGDKPTPTPAGSLGRYGFGTDVDGEDKGQFLRIDGIGTYDYGDVVLDITLKKYVNESVTSTTTGTITLHNWRSSIQPSITISSSLQSAGLVDLGTTTSTGQAIVEIGSSDRVLDENTRTYGPPRGTHYVMDISTNNSITYSNEHLYSIEGKGTVNYYSRLHIPAA